MRLNTRTIRGLLVRSGFYRPAMYLRRHLLRRNELASRDQSVGFFSSYIKQGDRVFDIGGNIGNTAEIFLRCGAKVVTLEPLPHCAAELGARFSGNSSFRCIQKAVGATPGSATLYIHRNDFMSSFEPEWSSEWLGSMEVPVTTIDELIKEFGLPAFLKIDVEGWEIHVLSGLSVPVPMLSFEFHSGGAGYDAVAASLAYLAKLAPIQINRTPQETWGLALPEWKSREAFLSDLKAHTIANPESYGDVLVRMSVPPNSA